MAPIRKNCLWRSEIHMLCSNDFMNYERTEALKDFVSELLLSRDTKLREVVQAMIDDFGVMRKSAMDAKDYEAQIRFTAKREVLKDVIALLEDRPKA